jgi:hypothetical protein
MRAKEQTLSRQKRREARGKRGTRGASFPGTAERPSQREQVFAAALFNAEREPSQWRSDVCQKSLSCCAKLHKLKFQSLAIKRTSEIVQT